MIYVTGSNGFIGKNLINFFKKKKKKFIKILRKNLNNKYKSHYRNLPNIKNISDNYLVHLSSPALVRIYRKKNYSLKTISKSLEYELSNASSLVDFCKINKFKKLIYVSSSSVYGARNYNAPFSEKNTPKPLDAYSQIKLKVENFMKKNYENLIILRPFQVYGKYDQPNRLIPTLINAKNNKKIFLQNCLQTTDLIHVDDFCNAVCKIINSKITKGVFNVGSGKSVKLRDIVELIHALKKKKFYFTYKKSYNFKISNYCYADINLIKKTFNWTPKIFFNKKNVIKLLNL